MRTLYIVACMLLGVSVYSQNMNNEQLYSILKRHADTIEGVSGNWKLLYKELPILCVTDEAHNRMRIIAPIIASQQLDEELLLDCLTANFHSALDVKYAISDGIMWSTFIHPLKELSIHQVESAINQVYLAAATFGTSFSSTELIFGGNQINVSEPDTEEKMTKTKTF